MAGAGGPGTGTTGAAGGGLTAGAGAGGAGSATGGVGGQTTVKGGLGGTGTTPGAGGAVVVQVAPTTALSTVITVSNQGTSTFQPALNTAGAVVAKGLTSQSGDLFAAQDSGANVLSRFDKNGYWMTRKTAVPADADLANGEAALWLDLTPGAPALRVKAKNGTGTVLTGSVPLA
jgi:hypothetical protein